MIVIKNEYNIYPETFLKGYILTNGVFFTEDALLHAVKTNAKKQNQVYNMPIASTCDRPQELLLRNVKDRYETVVSCVAPHDNSKAVIVDLHKGQLLARTQGVFVDGLEIEYVAEPAYYRKKMSSGAYVKKYISACGFDELNILPWKGCAISQMCKFCGANSFIDKNTLNAFSLSEHPELWGKYEDTYLTELEEAIQIAQKDECYKEHMHVILIAGNLRDHLLNFESEIFIKIAKKIKPLVEYKASEGIVLVISPPDDMAYLGQMKEAGVSKVVFNLEAITRNGFREFCPGKNSLGYDYFMQGLEESVKIFGAGNVWSNLVLGLEPNEKVLPLCKTLAEKGIVLSANVLHLDKGNQITRSVPSLEDIVTFFYELEQINRHYRYMPFYCSKALRTSLSNEAHDGRIIKVSKE